MSEKQGVPVAFLTKINEDFIVTEDISSIAGVRQQKVKETGEEKFSVRIIMKSGVAFTFDYATIEEAQAVHQQVFSDWSFYNFVKFNSMYVEKNKQEDSNIINLNNTFPRGLK